uniref:metal-sensing transcriptional repressor n=1 Tax=Eubacterium cellulosolvens TaxID=29322 RepID=UPI0009DD84B4
MVDRKDIDKKEPGAGKAAQEGTEKCCCGNSGEKDVLPDCCRHKTKERSEKEYKDLINRLSRIEGQVRGVRRMLEENAYCIDIMTQVAAVNAALNSFNKVLLSNHLQTCVTEDIREGREEKMDELLKILPKLMK